MKSFKTSLLLLLLTINYPLNAQNCDYDFSVSTTTYQDLTNSTSLNNGNLWDDPQYAIPIGFGFEVCGTTYHTIYFASNGTGGSIFSESVPQGILTMIIPFGQDIQDRGYIAGSSQSPLSYKTEGAVGNRILKIEWNNVGFFGEPNDYMNFQLWLYENSNVVEYRFGASSVSPISFDGETGPVTSFFPSINWDTNVLAETGYYLTGNPTNPTVVEIDAPSDLPASALSGMIPNGIIYTFTPEGLSISGNEKPVFSIYPNPASDFLNIKMNQITKPFQVEIYNLLGKKVNSFEISENNKIDISSLSSGIYFLKIKNENGAKEVKKIIKR